MDVDGHRRVRVVVFCAVTYLLVWGTAAAAGFIAGRISDRRTDMRGLGDVVTALALTLLVASALWAVVAFLVLARHGRRTRARIAALGTPVGVLVGVFVSATAAVGLALVLPALASWWATTPRAAASTPMP